MLRMAPFHRTSPSACSSSTDCRALRRIAPASFSSTMDSKPVRRSFGNPAGLAPRSMGSDHAA